MIKFYKTQDKYGYMSNFYRSQIFIYNNYYPTVEHAYQAAKTKDPSEKETIRNASTPRVARDLGQKCSMYEGFDEDRYNIMKECVLAKFSQNQELKEQLLSTGDQFLIEDSPVDYYWGCGADNTGENMLGKILIEVREELRNRS
jgi:ribA/ribD-fused uncharacterized protein